MEESEDLQIIFKRDDFEEEENCKSEWPDLYEEIARTLATSQPEIIPEDLEFLKEKRSDETIVTVSSEEISSSESLESVASLTHPCLKHVSVSDSQLKFLDIYNSFPVPEDPGIKRGFWTLYPHPPYYESDGVDKFFDVARALKVTPIASLRQQLLSDRVDLGHYGVDATVVRALCEALMLNQTVKELDLQGSILSDEACYHLNRLLMRNDALNSLNLTFCKIGVNGATRLEESISLSPALTVLNLSHCELGSKGFKCVATAVTGNTLLESLDVSSNDLDDDAAVSLQEMLTLNDSLKKLNLSWNYLGTKIAAERLFVGLTKNSCLTDLDLSWNSMAKPSLNYLTKYVIGSESIERLKIEANRFIDDAAKGLARALVANRSLKEFYMSKNPMGPTGISEFMNHLSSNKFIDSPLILLDLKSYWPNKDVVPVLDHLREAKPNLIVRLGGITGNYEIVGPDLKELYFKMANYEAMKPKRKRDQKNFGHFVLSLSDSNISKEKFMELVTDSKIQVSENLIKEIMKQFMVTKKSISQAAIKESYMTYFPDTKLPPSPPPKVEKTEDDKKEKKGKKGKKGKSKKGSPKKKKGENKRK